MTETTSEIEHDLTCAIGILAAIQHDEGIDHEDVMELLCGVRSAVHELGKTGE